MDKDSAWLPPEIASLALALGVGLLVGFERERRPDTVAGVRTFGLAGLIGGIAAMLGPRDATPWPLLMVTLISAAAGITGGIVARARTEESARRQDLGLTTAFALVATTLLGGFAVLGQHTTTIAGAGTLFLLLYIRDPLHAIIRRLAPSDVRAVAIFVLIALVILPVLPDRNVGPLHAVNPRAAWMLVVLVVSLSLAGYIAQALLGARAGTVATGLLGGLVSSTASTVGAARRVREGGPHAVSAAITLLSCGVLPLRLILLIGVASKLALFALWPWLAGIAFATLVTGFVSVRRQAVPKEVSKEVSREVSREVPTHHATRDERETTEAQALAKPRNPTQLSSALTFAAIFVVIQVLTKATIAYAGAGALLFVAAASGISDMDAIALTIARELEAGGMSGALAMRATLMALAVNTLFKLVLTRVLGDAKLFRAVLPGLGIAFAIAIAGIAFAS
ncbi:MAG: MgtC/SapB family protein [Limnohabitans sp.]|nr:MgtC/SapB family protein [Limnohabitans sp.]